MTQKEIASFFGFQTTCHVATAAVKAKNMMPSLQSKSRKGCFVEINYNLEETVLIAQLMGASLIEIELLKENFVEHPTKFISHKERYVDGMERFLERFEKSPKDCKCCDTCIYIQGKTVSHVSYNPKPFCAFYGKYLYLMNIEKRGKKVKVNIFTDKCPSYVKADKPFIFYKKS